MTCAFSYLQSKENGSLGSCLMVMLSYCTLLTAIEHMQQFECNCFLDCKWLTPCDSCSYYYIYFQSKLYKQLIIEGCFSLNSFLMHALTNWDLCLQHGSSFYLMALKLHTPGSFQEMLMFMCLVGRVSEIHLPLYKVLITGVG